MKEKTLLGAAAILNIKPTHAIEQGFTFDMYLFSNKKEILSLERGKQ
jgi:hypothetical protein